MNILIAGDYCPQNRVLENLKKGDFSSTFGQVRELINSADFSIVNLECPIINGDEKPIIKFGPNLGCSSQGIEALKWVGFDCVTLANNHFLDYGEKGVVNTLKVCSEYGLETVGGGKNMKEASAILYKNIDGQTLAVINCCEHEFSIATDTSAGSNPLNPIQQYYAIRMARKNADYVLVIVHGGHEHYQLPSPRMQETYRFFVDAGADAVVNHHQHCFSGYEVYKSKPIFYGLGNFCFDKKEKRHELWNEGYMVKLTLDREIEYELVPYNQCSDYPGIQLLDRAEFSKNLESLNGVIANNKQLQHEIIDYYKGCSNSYYSIFDMFENRYMRFLHKNHFLPSFLTKKKNTVILAYIQCESHLSKLIYALKNRLP